MSLENLIRSLCRLSQSLFPLSLGVFFGLAQGKLGTLADQLRLHIFFEEADQALARLSVLKNFYRRGRRREPLEGRFHVLCVLCGEAFWGSGNRPAQVNREK